jgi:hypothetical protein
MRTCYVALPSGVRRDAEGRMLDFEYLYSRVLKPTIDDAGLECRRLEEFTPGITWQRSLFTGILSSDLMIADISTQNPNVMYELGIRHALKRGRTLMISAGGKLPANVGHVQALFYRPDADGRLIGAAAEEFRSRLQSVIQVSRSSAVSDSPLYEFFPDIDVLLPPELELQTAWRTRTRSRGRTGVGVLGGTQTRPASRDAMVEQTRQREEEARSVGADPIEFQTVLRRYRDLSAWDELIRLADEAPASVAQSPEVRQLLALALNRRGSSGDQDRAIALMEQLITDTGGDAETFGVLGRIYKDRFEEARADDDAARAATSLDQALRCYRAGFEKNPKDIYTGFNVVTLLLQRDDGSGSPELAAFLPRIRAAVNEKIDSGRPDLRDRAIHMQLAAVSGEWVEAQAAARELVAHAGPGWQIESARRDLRDLGARLPAAARSHLDTLEHMLADAAGAEANDA